MNNDSWIRVELVDGNAWIRLESISCIKAIQGEYYLMFPGSGKFRLFKNIGEVYEKLGLPYE